MASCDFECVSDGICVSECNQFSNLCNLDIDCILEEDRARLLQQSGIFVQGFFICITFFGVCLLCTLCCCVIICTRSNRKEVTQARDWVSSWAMPLNVASVRFSSKEEEDKKMAQKGQRGGEVDEDGNVTFRETRDYKFDEIDVNGDEPSPFVYRQTM